jgi:hypothetical protein
MYLYLDKSQNSSKASHKPSSSDIDNVVGHADKLKSILIRKSHLSACKFLGGKGALVLDLYL